MSGSGVGLTPIFYVRIASRACTAEIRLNDAPIFVVVREHEQDALPTISEWVIDGENLLEVHLHAIGDDPRIRVSLCQARLGDVPEPGAELELAVIEWPPIPVPTGPETPDLPTPPFEAPALPLRLEMPCVAVHPWGEWHWQVAPPFAYDGQTSAALYEFLRSLHATLAAGSVDALIDQSRTKFDEVAPAYAMTPDEGRTRLRNAWVGMHGIAGWRLAPFDEQDVELRLHCGGRIVEPTTRDGQPLIRQAEAVDDEQWSLPIFLARTNWGYVEGAITIVR